MLVPTTMQVLNLRYSP